MEVNGESGEEERVRSGGEWGEWGGRVEQARQVKII